MLDVGDLAGLVLEVEDLPWVALLDHLLPPPREELTKVLQKFLVSYRVFYMALLPSEWVTFAVPRHHSAGFGLAVDVAPV